VAVAQALRIDVADVVLDANVTLPEHARGVVVFAHGSGSSRHSPRNRYVAEELQAAGLGTVLADLFTEQEERLDALTRELRFDISLLAERVIALTDWVTGYDQAAGLPVGLFGASTGAAAALVAAAARPQPVRAVVSRGGRPDLAAEALGLVRAPILLIVGENDEAVIDINRRAMERTAAQTQLTIVPGATHLFQEPGTLEQVAGLAKDWFVRHLAAAS
jgi:putative phosphoribosyl transferase